MFTPTRRRSYQDHRQYYENVKPKVITRWENGTPKMRGGKFVTKIERRMSDTFLIQPPSRTHQAINAVLEDNEDDDNVFINGAEEEENADDASLRAMESSRKKIDSAMITFSHIFGKLEEHMANASSEIEKAFIKKQVQLLVDGAKQVDWMMNDLHERTKRMEKFLENRNNGLDWNYWEN